MRVGEPGPFEAFYASAWQHPLALWLAAASGAAVCSRGATCTRACARYCLALAALSLLDAWLTADHVFGIGALPRRSRAPFRSSSCSRATSATCSLGRHDARRRDRGHAARRSRAPRPHARSFRSSRSSSPPAIAPGAARVLFLVYELAFCALTLALLRWHPNARALPWVRSVSRFVLLYYGLWAAADALLLATGSDLGYALRVIPNLLYYGGLSPPDRAGSAPTTPIVDRSRPRARAAPSRARDTRSPPRRGTRAPRAAARPTGSRTRRPPRRRARGPCRRRSSRAARGCPRRCRAARWGTARWRACARTRVFAIDRTPCVHGSATQRPGPRRTPARRAEQREHARRHHAAAVAVAEPAGDRIADDRERAEHDGERRERAGLQPRSVCRNSDTNWNDGPVPALDNAPISAIASARRGCRRTSSAIALSACGELFRRFGQRREAAVSRSPRANAGRNSERHHPDA